jgi:hypothetical protein
MAFTVLIHIANEQPILAEMEKLPAPADTIIIVQNPRGRDGKDLAFLAQNVTTVVWPVSRLTYLEVLPSEQEEKVVGFVRE